MSISESINKIIQDNLPESTAGEMRKFIQEAEDTKFAYLSLQKEMKELEKKYNIASDDNRSKLIKINELQETIKAYGDLVTKEKLIKKDQDELELKLTNIKLEEANKRAQIVMDLANAAFRNPTYRSTASDYKSGYDNQRGNYNDGITITKTIDQI